MTLNEMPVEMPLEACLQIQFELQYIDLFRSKQIKNPVAANTS